MARLFSTNEALHEYTIKTASYFPRDSRKAGKLLRRLLRRTDEKEISLTDSSLVPSRHIHKQGVKTKDKNYVPPSGRRSEKRRLIAEQIETINAYSCVEFDSS